MLNPEDPTVKAAVFGRQVEDFVNGDIGRFITKRADDEIAASLDKLKNTNPHTAAGQQAIAGLQFQIHVAERVIHWLAEAITEGQQALAMIEDKHE